MQLQYGLPLNLLDWAERNKGELKPPVCNAAIWPDGDYIINMVGGPNTRTDFHDNPAEEIFYQLKGSAYINVWDRGRFERIDLREGDIFLLPAHVMHSPQRPEPGLCFLVERPRPQGEHDGLHWYCPVCAGEIWHLSKQLDSLVDDLPKAYQAFYAIGEDGRRCKHCGTVHPGKDYVAWHDMHLRAQH